MPKILAYPPDRNPYQRLLYDAIAAAHPQFRVGYCKPVHRLGVLWVPAQLLARRLQGYRILHLHWPDFRVPRWLPFRGPLAVRAPRAVLRFAHAIGYGIVWTVHEIVPHEPRTTDDLTVARGISRAADAVIAHSPATIEAMNAQGLSTERVSVIPLGNYIDVYGPAPDRATARKALGLPDDAFVILTFGLLRPYKGIEALIDSVRSSGDASLRLVIAGRTLHGEFRALLHAAAEADERIVIMDGYIPDEDVPLLHAACDVVATPFLQVTTSSSAILGLGFGRPLIAPRTGNLRELPEDVGFLYPPDEPDALEDALRAARASDRLDAMGRAARAYAETLAWPGIGEATWAVYQKVL